MFQKQENYLTLSILLDTEHGGL